MQNSPISTSAKQHSYVIINKFSQVITRKKYTKSIKVEILITVTAAR